LPPFNRAAGFSAGAIAGYDAAAASLRTYHASMRATEHFGMRTSRIRRLSLEQWGHIFNIGGVLIGIVSILCVMVQLQENNKITRAENAQKLVELTMVSDMQRINDPKLASVWTDGNANYDALSTEDKRRLRIMWLVYFNILESAFHQRDDGLIEEEDFLSRSVCLTLNKGVLLKIWPELSHFYPARFQRYVSSSLARENGSREPRRGSAAGRSACEDHGIRGLDPSG
jgi:hypothetical protein